MANKNLFCWVGKKIVVLAMMASIISSCKSKCDMDSLEIIPRSEWGAVDPDIAGSVEGEYDKEKNPGGWFVYNEPLSEVMTTIVVHHSALPLRDGPLEIQKKHMEIKKFADIGYHYLIDENGKIYEGRNLHVRGAHTGGYNTGAIGIVLLGNFEETEPSDEQIQNLILLSNCLRKEYKITHIAGHRDFQPEETVCPGKNLEEMIIGIAKELKIEFGIEGYVGPPE
jgi:hypothetical protein